MPKIRDKSAKPKIDGKLSQNQGCCSEQYPWFSFRYMTSNSRYNLSKLPNGPEGDNTYKALYKRLVELSSQPWQYWLGMHKQNGFETIDYHELNFQPNQNIVLTKDIKLYVVRFDTYKNPQGGRIIGFKQSPCAAFHIIGYDIDFSAYPH